MPSKDTTTKFKADISQLKSQMQAASRAVKVATSEFKAATAGLDDWSKSADGLGAKLKQLDTILSSQNSSLAMMEEELEKTVKVYGENSAAADNVRIKINNQKAAIAQTQKQIAYYNQELEDCKNGVGKFAKEEDLASTASGKLKKSISDQESELADLKKQYVETALAQGENSDEAKELAEEIKKLSSELVTNKAKLEGAEDSADKFDESLKDVDKSSGKASEGFTVMKGALANLVADGIKYALSAMKDLAAETFTAGANFESSMSKVQAISGASAEDMEKLTAKAKEMGETSVFSASESADALQYMAMAGWDTEDMLNGLEGIMNLAAASGEDLATTSDIVTDALTAMGYSAGDAGKLADVMAAASSNANTNVSLMGQTFQSAAPIVGALGYNMEDTAVAIGLMANAGIKGEKAGTALRSILTRLSAPPKECADAMEELGVSLTDSEGNMKSLDEVMGDLRKGFDGLSETQQTQYAKAIAGQEAMSGLLAVVNAAPEDFDKLTKAVNESAGAADEMAATMNDNVNGQITLLRSNIEGKMIKVFERASSAMKRSIREMGRALDSIDWDKTADSVGDLAEGFADFVTFLVTNAPAVKATLKAIGTAMAAIFITNKIATFVDSLKTISPALVTLATKIGLVTVATEGETAATVALNTAWLASPITWLIAGVAALTAGVVAYTKHVNDQIEAEYGLTDAQKETIANAKSLKDTYDDINSTRMENNKAVESEYDYIRELKDEYNSLIDSNGNVKQGYEDRATFILNELAKAMGVEVSQIEEAIDANGKLGDSIDQLILKQQAQALLTANEEAYNTAIQNRAEALETYLQAQQDVNDAEAKWNEVKDEYNSTMEEYNRLLKENPSYAGLYLLANKKIIDGGREAASALEDAKEGMTNAQDAYIGYNTTIENYKGLGSAIISGDADAINQAMANMTYNFQTAETSNRESLERQVDDLEKNYEDMKAAIENGTPGVTQGMVDQSKSMVDAAKAELAKLPPEAGEIGEESGEKYSSGLGSKSGDAEKAGQNVSGSAKSGVQSNLDSIAQLGGTSGTSYSNQLSSKSGDAKQAGQNVSGNAVAGITLYTNQFMQSGTESGQLYKEGIDSKQSDAKQAGKDLKQKAYDGSTDSSIDSRSSGSFFGEGFFNGIGDWFGSVFERGKELAKNALSGLKKGGKEGSPWRTTKQSGKWFGEGFDIGMNSMLKTVVKSATNMAIDAYNALDVETDNMDKLGLKAGQNFSDGLKASITDVKASVKGLSEPLSDVKVSGQIMSAKVSPVDNTQGVSSVKGNETTIINKNVTLNQYNNSPKSLDRLSIYRDTNSLLFSAKARLSDV